MLKSFFHTGFVVKDIEASLKFYADVLGMRIAARTEREGEFIEQVLEFPGFRHGGQYRPQCVSYVSFLADSHEIVQLFFENS